MMRILLDLQGPDVFDHERAGGQTNQILCWKLGIGG